MCGLGYMYVGASNMSSQMFGVQERIKQEASLVMYVHCGGNYLYLVISKSGTLQIQNVFEYLRNCCRYFLNSLRRNGSLESIVQQNVSGTERKKQLLDLYKTTCAECHCAYKHFYEVCVFILEELEMTGFHHHLDKYGHLCADWDSVNSSGGQLILASITSFVLIMVFMSMYQYMSHLTSIAVKLQEAAIDFVKAHQMESEMTSTYKEERQSVDTCRLTPCFCPKCYFTKKFQAAVMMAWITVK